MSEDAIKTAEEQLHEIIKESSLVLIKLKKTLNVLWYVGGGVVVTFFLSFVDVRSRMATLEETKISKDKVEEKYATKAGVVFLQNDIYELNASTFEPQSGIDEAKVEMKYNNALKTFFGDVSRSGENVQ